MQFGFRAAGTVVEINGNVGPVSYTHLKIPEKLFITELLHGFIAEHFIIFKLFTGTFYEIIHALRVRDTNQN